MGRAEVYMSGDWVSICSSGFTAGSEAVLDVKSPRLQVGFDFVCHGRVMSANLM